MKSPQYFLLLAILTTVAVSCNPAEKDTYVDSTDEVIATVVDTVVREEEPPIDTTSVIVESVNRSLAEFEEGLMANNVEMTGSIRYDADYNPTYHYTITNDSDYAVIAYEIGHIVNQKEISDWEIMNREYYRGVPKPAKQFYTIKKLKKRVEPKNSVTGEIKLSSGDTKLPISLISFIDEDGMKHEPDMVEIDFFSVLRSK